MGHLYLYLFETLRVFLGQSDDTHMLFYNPENIFCHFFCIFNLDYF